MLIRGSMSPVTTTIIEKLQELSAAQQQVVLEVIELLRAETTADPDPGRLDELRREIQIGMASSARGEVIAGEVMFAQLRAKLQQRRTVGQG
jgi:hypothetical protein